MSSPAARDYQTVINRLAALPAEEWRVEKISEVSHYPFFRLERNKQAGAPTVFLSGGVHGDEPAGVEAVLQWLEGDTWKAFPFNWLVLPCVNPFGWAHDQRTNAQGRDINRQFRGPTCSLEALLVKECVSGKRFLFSMDFHEDCDSPGYYLCELTNGAPPLAEKIVEAVRQVLPLNRSPRLDGKRATGEGFMRRAPACPVVWRTRKHWPLAFDLVCHHAAQTFCSETPSRDFALSRRVEAHHAALSAALRAFVPLVIDAVTPPV